ncbi:MAG: c-type cytochrome [Flavisolibacter sp.]
MIKYLLTAFILLPIFIYAQVKKQKIVHKSVTVNKTSLQASILNGKTVYAANCLTCHQVDGSGVPNLNPPLIRTKWVLGDRSVLIKQVLNGSKGKIEIDGESFHNVMPPLSKLTDQQIADVITYVRNSFGNKGSIVTPQQVKSIRDKTAKP